jgi:hypothetical protein
MVMAAALVLGVAACSDEDAQDAKVKAVVTDFLRDAADGKGTEACSALTGDAVRYVSTVGVVAQSTASCPEAVNTLSGQFAADEKKALRGAKVKNVSVSGDRATIAREDVEIDYKGQSHLFPTPTNSPIVLIKTDAGWKIESLG